MTVKKNKKDIISSIAEKTNLKQVQVSKVIHLFFDEVIGTLEEFGVMELRNFGIYKVKKCKPRKARNPRNNETVMVDEKYVVKFKAGREMAERIQKSKIEPHKQIRKTNNKNNNKNNKNNGSNNKKKK